MVLSMEHWRGKVAVVTGAGGGIGTAVVQKLLSENLQVVGIDNRSEALDCLSKKLKGGKLFTYNIDITKDQDVIKFFKKITEELGPVHILINCAGIVRLESLIEGKTETWKNVLDVNVLGICIMTREAVKIMREKNIDGHIIHVCSIAGHRVVDVPDINIYPASKFAVRALTETHQQELKRSNLKIKVTNISPGKVNTLIVAKSDLKIDLDAMPGLDPSDIADAMTYALSTPPHVQVHQLTIQPVGEIF